MTLFADTMRPGSCICAHLFMLDAQTIAYFMMPGHIMARVVPLWRQRPLPQNNCSSFFFALGTCTAVVSQVSAVLQVWAPARLWCRLGTRDNEVSSRAFLVAVCAGRSRLLCWALLHV